jgi:hypothetical protein
VTPHELLTRAKGRKLRLAQSQNRDLVKTPSVLSAGGKFTTPSSGELYLVMRAAVSGVVNFATVRGKTLHVKDVANGGKVKLGWFEKGTVIDFGLVPTRAFDIHVRTSSTGTSKIASHL